MNHKKISNVILVSLAFIFVVSACKSIIQPNSTIPSTATRNNNTSLEQPIASTAQVVEEVTPVNHQPSTTQEVEVSFTPTSPSHETPMTSTATITDTLLMGPLISFRVQDNQMMYLLIFDISTQTFREIRNPTANRSFEVVWVDDGCGIYLGDIIDLRGDVVWQMPILNWEMLKPKSSHSSEFTRLSPDRKWLAYDILYGDKYYEGAEWRDIGIVNLDDTTEFTLLTNDGSASKFSWSPNSQWISFARADSLGIAQIFRSTPDGLHEQQLTEHSTSFGIGYVTWSPDGRFIAYAVYNLSEETGGGIGIIDLENSKQFLVIPHKNFTGISLDEIWWEQEGTRLLFSGISWNGAEEIKEIYWINATTGIITNSFLGSNGPNGFIRSVYPVGNIDTILFSSRDGYYLLDASNNSFEKFTDHFEINGQIYDSEITPFTFTGEANCQ